MCNQAVSLLAAAIESRGIPTVCLMLLREVAEHVRPPRALVVPYPHGFPLGKPHDPAGQREVLRAALALLGRTDVPLVTDFEDSTRGR